MTTEEMGQVLTSRYPTYPEAVEIAERLAALQKAVDDFCEAQEETWTPRAVLEQPVIKALFALQTPPEGET
jgi:hypothetical protein